MKHIVKEKSPLEFEDWKIKNQLTESDLASKKKLDNDKAEIWKKFTKKTAVRNKVKEYLLIEQGFICCYCQQRVELNEKTTIEHFEARKKYPSKMFNYENIFACCDGGQGERTKQENKTEIIPKYCGHAKENETLSINPLDDNCESHFRYSFNFDFDDPEVQIEDLSPEAKDAIQKLNLDIQKLRSARGKAIVELIYDENNEIISDEEIEILFSIIKQKSEDKKFRPFCVVLEHVLQSLLPEQNYVF